MITGCWLQKCSLNPFKIIIKICNAIKDTKPCRLFSVGEREETQQYSRSEEEGELAYRREQCSRFKNASFMFHEKGDAFITFCDKCTQCKHPEGSTRLISAKWKWIKNLFRTEAVRCQSCRLQQVQPELSETTRAASTASENSFKAWKDIKHSRLTPKMQRICLPQSQQRLQLPHLIIVQSEWPLVPIIAH